MGLEAARISFKIGFPNKRFRRDVVLRHHTRNLHRYSIAIVAAANSILATAAAAASVTATVVITTATTIAAVTAVATNARAGSPST